MKPYPSIVLILSVALPTIAAEQASVAEGTVSKVDSTTKTILVKTKDGTEHTFRFGGRMAVHGADATSAGSKDAWHSIKSGSEVAVHYTAKGTDETAVEVDRIGSDGLKATEGTVTKIDRGAKTMTIATTDGTEETFRLLDRAAVDSGKDIGTGADKSAKVTVYYTEQGGSKVAHFFKSAF
jgi:hypothetical protein